MVSKKFHYTVVTEMAQKVFEGDVVFSILIDREKNRLIEIENSTSPSKTFWAISGTPVYYFLINDPKNKSYKDVIIKMLQSSFSFMKCPQAMFLFWSLSMEAISLMLSENPLDLLK